MLALTGDIRVPSARFRVGQFVAPLDALGLDLCWRPAPVSNFPPRRTALRPLWLPATTAARLPSVAATWAADVTLLQRELVSTLATLEWLTRKPRVLDVDDAIWMRRGGGFAARIARGCELVIAGNDYVADWFSRHCPHVAVLPTAVDTERFRPRADIGAANAGGRVVLGWSGTSSNLSFLSGIEGALARVLRERPCCRLAVCCDKPPQLGSLPADRVDYMPWHPGTEAEFFRNLDVGLMPLPDDDWTRGKCSYKMLLYLACGVPVVVAPVGMNAQVLAQADVGSGATTQGQWVDALIALTDNPALRRKQGSAGSALVTARYSVAALAPRLAVLLEGVASGGS
ncbi:MAG: glycosyltransferase [bacterium]|nr:glycosyltransferase [bacterium]